MQQFTFTTRDHTNTDFHLKCINHTGFFIINNSYEEVAIPGRGCPFIRDSESKERVEVEIYCVLDSDNLFKDCINIKTWLAQDTKDKEIYISNMPGYYLKGFLSNKLNIEEVMRQTGQITLKFNCQPFLYMESGNLYIPLECEDTITEETILSGEAITNPGLISKPLIKITCTGDVQFTIGDCTVKLKDTNGTYYIDSEIMEMYMYSANSNISLQNSKMYSDFPILNTGDNIYTYTENKELGRITSLQIMPRWRV